MPESAVENRITQEELDALRWAIARINAGVPLDNEDLVRSAQAAVVNIANYIGVMAHPRPEAL